MWWHQGTSQGIPSGPKRLLQVSSFVKRNQNISKKKELKRTSLEGAVKRKNTKINENQKSENNHKHKYLGKELCLDVVFADAPGSARRSPLRPFLHKDTYAYDEGAPNRGPLKIPMNSFLGDGVLYPVVHRGLVVRPWCLSFLQGSVYISKSMKVELLRRLYACLLTFESH